jgi:hypothetical protein
MLQNAIWVVIVIIILFIIYYTISWHTDTYEDYMYGFWTADNDAFCTKAGVESIMLFIGAPEQRTFKGRTTRPCHLLVMNDIENVTFDLTYNKSPSSPSLTKPYQVVGDMKFHDKTQWPDDATFIFDMRNGSLKIKSGAKNLGILLKQHDITNVAKLEEKSES